MKRIIGLFVLGMVLFVPAFAQNAATVNLTRSENITVAQLRAQVETLERENNRSFTAAERRQVLDVMINQKLLMQAAERDRLGATDNEINQQLQQLRSQLAQNLSRQPTDAEFAQAIRTETGLELNAFREQLRTELTTQKYLLAKKQTELQGVRIPTEADIVNTYNQHRTSFVRPDTVRVSMIQVPFTDAASRTRVRPIADRLVTQIGNDPSKFDEITRTASADYRAGDAGYLPRNAEAQQLVGQQFFNAAFSLRQGQVSGLLETPNGFLIIKITETYAQKNLELDDIYQLGSPYTVRDYIGNALLEQNQQELLARVTQELVAELRRGNPYQIYENNLNW